RSGRLGDDHDRRLGRPVRRRDAQERGDDDVGHDRPEPEQQHVRATQPRVEALAHAFRDRLEEWEAFFGGPPTSLRESTKARWEATRMPSHLTRFSGPVPVGYGAVAAE